MKVRKSPGVAIENRSVKLDRSAAPEAGRQFTGHAAVYNQRAAIGNPLQWGFYEQVATGAFDKSLRDGDQVMLADHDPSKPIARTSVGTLLLVSDTTGLAVDVPTVPDLSYGDDLLTNVRVGNVAGMSFGFRVVQDTWELEQIATSDGMTAEVEVRTLVEVQLIEVSTTPFPAYTGTDAAVRCVRAAQQSRRARGQRVPAGRPRALLAAAAGSLRVGATISAATLEQLQAAQDALASDDSDTASSILDDLIALTEGDDDDDGDPAPDPAADVPAAAGQNDGFPLDLAIRQRILAETQGLALTTF